MKGRLRQRFREDYAHMDPADIIQLWIAVTLQVVIFTILVLSLFEGRGQVTFSASIVFVLTFLPAMINWQFETFVPIEFVFVNTLFLFASFVLGDLRQFYDRFWWWDMMLHGFSAIIMGIIGFLLIYVFYASKKVTMPPFYILFFSFSFSLSLGALWEIVEYLVDISLGTHMQQSGLDDTMKDLMMDTLGALVAALIGYLYYVKKNSFFAVDRIVRKMLAKRGKLT